MTLRVVKMSLQERSVVFGRSRGTVFASIRLFVEDGFITSAEGIDKTWEASFVYAVDPELREVLLKERQELLDSLND